MKKRLLTLICATSLVLGSIASVNAQDTEIDKPNFPKHERVDKEKRHEGLVKKLNLTAEQEAKAKALREEGHKKMEPLIDEMKKVREKMDELRKEDMKAFEDILTDEQKAEFKKMKDEMKEKRGHKFGKKFKHNKPGRKGPRDTNRLDTAEPASETMDD